MSTGWRENGIILTAVVAGGALALAVAEYLIARRPLDPIVVAVEAATEGDDDADAKSANAAAVPLYASAAELTESAKQLLARPQPDADVLHELARQARELRLYPLADELLARCLEVDPNRVETLFLRARTQSDLGQPDRAIAMYREVVARAPNHQKATYNLGVLFRRTGNLKNADVALARAAEISSGRIKARALHQRGLVQGSAGDWDLAAKYLRESVQLRPSAERVWLDLGQAEERRGQPDAAYQAYGKALALKPRFADGHLAMGLFEDERGKRAEAEKHLARAVKIDGDDPRYRKALARHYLAAGDTARARSGLTWLARNGDSEADRAYAQAMLALLDRDTERMLAEVRRADQLAPGAYDDAIEQAASALHERRRFTDARALLGLLLARPRPSAEVLLVAARTASQLGDSGEAESLLRRSLQANPRSSEAWFQLGRILSARDDVPGAIAAYQVSLARNPDARNTRLNLAVLHARSGNESAALALYAQILKTHPRYTPALLNRARLHERAGRVAEAVADLETAMRAAPTDTGIRERLARLLLSRGETDRARVLLSDAVAESPADANVRMLLAETELKAGRRVDALRELNRAAALAGDDAIMWARLSKGYREAGDQAAAQSAKTRAELRTQAVQTKEAQ